MPAAVGVVAGVAYSGFLVYFAFPSEGVDATTVVSTLEAEGAPYGALLRGLDVRLEFGLQTTHTGEGKAVHRPNHMDRVDAVIAKLHALSAILTLVLVPYLWWALPGGVWRQVAVWSTAVFAAFGIPAGLIALPCAEGEPACPDGGAEELQSFAHDATSIVSTTALIAAAHLGHDEVVRELIRGGAPLDHVNNLGWTAALEAVILGDGGPRHVAVLRALVEAGADPGLPDRQGVTPLEHARRRGYAEMVAILESARRR